MNNSKCLRPAIVHGLYLCFIPSDYETIKTEITIPVIPLRSVSQFYDSFLDMEASECNFKQKANMESQRNVSESLIYERTFFAQDIRQLMELSEETTTQSAYVSSEIEMIMKRESNEYEIYLHREKNAMEDRCILRVTCGGYFINEFCESNGYEQILFLPLQSEYKLALSSPTGFQKRIICSFLKQCVLLHDQCLFGHSTNALQLSKNDKEILLMQLPVMKVLSDDNLNDVYSPITIAPPVDDQGSEMNGMNGEGNTAQESSSDTDGKENWKETLRKATQRRLNDELDLCKKKNDIASIQKYMNIRGRRTLQQITVAGTKVHKAMPRIEIVKMACRLEPGSNGTNGLEATIFMNVDIAFSKCSSLSTLYNVQLCVTPHSKEHTKLNIQTNSAVIPIMRKEDCFTIMSSILVSNVKFEREVDIKDDTQQIRFTVSAFYSDKLITSRSPKPEMNGIILGFLSLPYESFVLHQNSPSHYADDTIYTAPRPLGDTMESNAIFDYRVPRIILLDVSSSCSSSIGNDWQSMIDAINEGCIRGNRVDFHFDPEQMRVSLSIFGSSPEHRLCLLRQVMRKIPDEICVIGTNACTWKQEYLAKAYLENVEIELQLMNCCQIDSSKEASRKILKDLFIAQSMNDEISSIIATEYHQGKLS
jgi:hypothetical protein